MCLTYKLKTSAARNLQDVCTIELDPPNGIEGGRGDTARYGACPAWDIKSRSLKELASMGQVKT